MAEALTIDKPETIIAPYEGIFTDVQRADDGRITWKATVSDDGVDKYATRMTTDLHEDFIRNWKAGEPCFLTIGHFFGASRIGDTTAMYRDGRKLKAEGRFFTDDADPFVAKLAQAAANAALAEAGNLPTERNIKTSIGFNPRAYVNEDLDVMAYTQGVLPEITMTTHAANSRTDFGGQDMTKRALDPEFQEQDAASIVGDELAAEIAARDAALHEERAGEPEEQLLYRALTVDSEELPANVKKMDDAQRKAWVKTYNAAMAKDANEADAKKAANAFVKNMKVEKSGERDIDPLANSQERAGRKIQGKKLAQLKEAAQQIADILAWAEQAADDEGRSIIVRAHFTEPLEAGGNLDEIAVARYMDLTGEESLAAILDYKAMWDYLYTLQYSFMDLLMANLNPESELTTPERMANIDTAFADFKALVNGIISQYFSNDGRTIEEGDNTDMKDVKPTDKGTATVKPGGESEGRTKFDDVADKIRQHIVDGDRDGLQELLNTELAPALLEDMGEEAEAEVPAEITERLSAHDMQLATIGETLTDIQRMLQERPPESRSEPETPQHPYRPAAPRRRGITRPPAEPQRTQTRVAAPVGPKRYSIAEAASLKTQTPYP